MITIFFFVCDSMDIEYVYYTRILCINNNMYSPIDHSGMVLYCISTPSKVMNHNLN